MKEQISQWLNAKGITDCKVLRLNNEFILFLIELFPDKNEEQVKEKIFQCCLAMGEINGFIDCLSIALAN